METDRVQPGKRQRAEDAELRESELKYRRLFETAQDGILILEGESGEILDANTFILDMLGYPLEYFIGKHLWELGFIRDKSFAENAFLKLQQDSYIRYEDLPLETKTGERIDVEFISNVYPVNHHRIIQCNIRNITDRKRAEDALRESNEYLHKLLEFANAPIIVWDPAFRITRFNHAFEHLTGRSEQEVLGQPLDILFPDESRNASLNLINKTLEGEHWETVEIPILTRESGIRTVLWNSANILDPDRRIISTIAQGVDITERKRAEDALQESEKRYRDIFEHNAAVMLIINPETGSIMGANSAASLYYGYSQEEFSGLAITDINTADPATIRKNMSRATEERGGEFHFLHRKKSGEIRNVDVFTAPVTLGGQRLLLSIVQDVTERNRAEEALQLANRKLNLLSGITRHDIKNQLVALSGYLGLSRKSLGDPALMAEFIAKEEKIADTIGRQINFTRDYEDLGVKAPVWQNISRLVRNVLARLPMKDVRVDPGDPGLEVFADPLLEKVFYNLVDNALRYGGEQMTSIRVTSQKDNGMLVIAVHDDGTGIRAEDKTRLFTKGFGKNTGLGLYLSREILSITGITIRETGTPGKGARFEIAVPEGAFRFERRSAEKNG